jgi:hypothetical protein
MVNRIAIAQSALNALTGGPYLEIGVNTGESFIPIRANRKWGVDPDPKLSKKRLLKYAVFSALKIKFEDVFRLTSDHFFASKADLLRTHGIDVCFVDGLHTYKQALRDVLNAVAYLKPKGIILMHDCNPSTELMASPAASICELIQQKNSSWTGEWSGDVWKAIVHLRSLHQELSAFVLDCDRGVGVVTKGRPRSKLAYSADEIRAMDYKFLAANRNELLDLRPPVYFKEFLRRQVAL